MENETLAQKISARLIGARNSKALSQSELADKVEVSLRSVQNWEDSSVNGSAPRGKNLRRLSEVLGVPIAYLLGEDVPTGTIVASQTIPAYQNSPSGSIRERIHALVDRLIQTAGDDDGKLWWIYHEIERHFNLASEDRERTTETRAKMIVAGVLPEAQRAGAESGSSQTAPSNTDTSAAPKVPSPASPTPKRTPPKPAPK